MPDGLLPAAEIGIVPGLEIAPLAGPMMATFKGAQLRIARSTFNRPPVLTFPAREATASTVLSNVVLSCAVVKEHLDNTNAAAPDTWGVAIDVPMKDA